MKVAFSAVVLVLLAVLAQHAEASTVQISTVPLKYVNKEQPLEFTATFSERVSGVQESDFNLYNGANCGTRTVYEGTVYRTQHPGARRPDGWEDPIANSHTYINATTTTLEEISLGFTFTWAGASYTSVRMSISGWVGFGTSSTPTSALSSSEPGAVVLLNSWEMDKNISHAHQGGMYYTKTASSATFTWYRVSHQDEPVRRGDQDHPLGNTATFQVTLDKDTGVHMRYLDVSFERDNQYHLGQGSFIGVTTASAGLKLPAALSDSSAKKVFDSDNYDFPINPTKWILHLTACSNTGSGNYAMRAYFNAGSGSISPALTSGTLQHQIYMHENPVGRVVTETEHSQYSYRYYSDGPYPKGYQVVAYSSSPVFAPDDNYMECKLQTWPYTMQVPTRWFPVGHEPARKWIYEYTYDTNRYMNCKIVNGRSTPGIYNSETRYFRMGSRSSTDSYCKEYRWNEATYYTVGVGSNCASSGMGGQDCRCEVETDVEGRREPIYEILPGHSSVTVIAHNMALYGRSLYTSTTLRALRMDGGQCSTSVDAYRWRCITPTDGRRCLCELIIPLNYLEYRCGAAINTESGYAEVLHYYNDRGHEDEFQQTKVHPRVLSRTTRVDWTTGSNRDLSSDNSEFMMVQWQPVKEIHVDTEANDRSFYDWDDTNQNLYRMDVDCRQYDQWGGDWVLQLSMGETVEYIKPNDGTSTVCEVLRSNNKHLVSYHSDGGWRKPVYSSDPYVNGGSIDEPLSQPHIFWGSDREGQTGACCNSSSTSTISAGWHQPLLISAKHNTDWIVAGAFAEDEDVQPGHYEDQSEFTMLDCSKFDQYGDLAIFEVRTGGDFGTWADMFGVASGKTYCDAIKDRAEATYATSEWATFGAIPTSGIVGGRQEVAHWLSKSGETGGCCHIADADKTVKGQHGFTVRVKEWLELAVNDGSDTFTSSDFTSGVSNKIKPCAQYDTAWTDGVLVRVTMGDFVDYYKPSGSLCDLLDGTDASYTWAPGSRADFVAPGYPTGQLGGSTDNPGIDDGRTVLPAWGHASNAGGFGHLTSGDTASWGRAFKIHVRPVTPVAAVMRRESDLQPPKLLSKPVVALNDGVHLDVEVAADTTGYMYCVLRQAQDLPPQERHWRWPTPRDNEETLSARGYSVEAGSKTKLRFKDINLGADYDLYCMVEQFCPFCREHYLKSRKSCRLDSIKKMAEVRTASSTSLTSTTLYTIAEASPFVWDLSTQGRWVDPGITVTDERSGELLVTYPGTWSVPDIPGTYNQFYTIEEYSNNIPHLFPSSVQRQITLTNSTACYPTVGSEEDSCLRKACYHPSMVVDTETVTFNCTFDGDVPRYGDFCKFSCAGGHLHSPEVHQAVCGAQGKWQWVREATAGDADEAWHRAYWSRNAQYAHEMYHVIKSLSFRTGSGNVFPLPTSYDPMDRCYGPCLIDGVVYNNTDINPGEGLGCLKCLSKYNYAEWTQTNAVCRHPGAECASTTCDEEVVCKLDTSGSSASIPYASASSSTWSWLYKRDNALVMHESTVQTGPTICAQLQFPDWPDY